MFANGLGDNDNPTGAQVFQDEGGDLVSWCMTRVKRARDVRDEKYAKRWDEYTRLWRGFWAEVDKNTNSERSQLVSPALAQAIEMSVSEIEEALFSRIAWFDVSDDIVDEQKDDALMARDRLLEDFELASVPDAIAKAVLMGGIYGTGIAKINIQLHSNTKLVDGEPLEDVRPLVTVEAIRPDEFVIDPSATSVDEALFCAHEVVKPQHSIKQKQSEGIYRKGDIGTYTGERGDTTGLGTTKHVDIQDGGVLITEYFGKVPAKLLANTNDPEGTDDEDASLVEAIVTFANEKFVLRAIKNPFLMEDRPVVAYQHDTVPGEFWGRGVAEKGYNPQKALDAELRSRIDSLALLTAPMLGADITRMPRNPDMRVRPGKIFMTRGRPSEIIEPIGFNPTALSATFQQASDLERMVQTGTGSMDSASPLSTNRRNETASGMSMIQTGMLKRSKRTMQNIERQFLNPLIRRSLWRYMQFAPDRYPKDYKFKVRSAMGIMAKEVESSQLVQMLGFTPPESPAHKLILSALFDNTASAEKAELKKAMQAMLAPPSEQEQQMQQMMQQLQVALAEAELAKTKSEAAKNMAQAQSEAAGDGGAAAKAALEAEFVKKRSELQMAEMQVKQAQQALELQAAKTELALVRKAAELDKKAAQLSVESHKTKIDAERAGETAGKDTVSAVMDAVESRLSQIEKLVAQLKAPEAKPSGKRTIKLTKSASGYEAQINEG